MFENGYFSLPLSLIFLPLKSCLVILMIISVFQFACDVKAEVIGKPSATFFLTALDKIQVLPEDVSVS